MARPNRSSLWLLLTALATPAGGQAAPADAFPEIGATVYRSKCLLCLPNSPGKADGPRYKARPDAVPLWTLYEPGEGWQESQVGLGRWSDDKMARWLRYPKGMKPDTAMIEVPLEPAKREAVIRYIKYLGREY